MSAAPAAHRRRAWSALAVVLAVVLGLPFGMPLAAAQPAAPGIPRSAEQPASAPATTARGPIRLDAVVPPVAVPGSTIVLTGQLAPTTPLAAGATATLRLVRARTLPTSRSEVDAWATGTGAVTGTELARVTVTGPADGSTAVPFRVEVAADALRITRATAAVPLALELTSDRSAEPAVLRTFVGWQRAADGPPMRIALAVPVTLAPDPALTSDDDAAREAAWQAETGPTGRLTTLVSTLTTDGGSAPVSYAVDPAVLGPTGRTPAAAAADPATQARAPLARALSSAAGRRDELLALPYADPDLAAIASSAGSAVVTDLVRRSAALGTGLSVPTLNGVAWPVDEALPTGREEALRAAYAGGLRAVLTSADAVTGPTVLTTGALALAPGGTTVLRADDRLGELLAGGAVSAAGQGPGALTQLVIAHTAALYGERPAVARSVLVTLPRTPGVVTDPAVVAAYQRAVAAAPWLAPTTVGGLLAGPSGDLPPLPQPPPAPTDQPPPTPVSGLTVGAVVADTAVLRGLSSSLVDPAIVARPLELADHLLATRWRGAAAAQAIVSGQLRAQVAELSNGLRITPQTTNFLADEGLLQVTVVNDLPVAVSGVRVVLAPTNPRLQVVEQPPTVSVGARSRANVSIRLVAVTQGLVPINASLRAADGSTLGPPSQIIVRANPPGVWLYVGGGVLLGGILLLGAVRKLRKPPSPEVVAAAESLDPVLPTPEEVVVDPVETSRGSH
ncbi:MAG TPA: DUF6049 family protein [Dermatophilaceae bacterium]|nr:DUF6049 family protein [Dermatophilaceae bacterium]